nr:hypothetical protein [Tanacetum cinerariifolium]
MVMTASVAIGVGERIAIRLPCAAKAFPILVTVICRNTQGAGATSTPRGIPGICFLGVRFGCAWRNSWILTLGAVLASPGLFAGFVTVVTRGVVFAITLVLLKVTCLQLNLSCTKALRNGIGERVVKPRNLAPKEKAIKRGLKKMFKKLLAEEVDNIPWTVPKKFHCANVGFVRPNIAPKAIRRKRIDFGRRIAQFCLTYSNVVKRSESGANDGQSQEEAAPSASSLVGGDEGENLVPIYTLVIVVVHIHMVAFSKLPLDMVTMIISFLKLEDAIRLCLMQKEWFQLRLWNQCSSSELGVVPILARLDKKQKKEDHHDSIKQERKTLHHGITNGSSK